MIPEELIDRQGTWLRNHGKRLMKNETDCLEAEVWGLNHLLNECGVRIYRIGAPGGYVPLPEGKE